MYVDDRLGRRSRARSGLDQLDVAEDLLAEVAAAVAVCALGPKRRRPEVSSLSDQLKTSHAREEL